jgi:3-methyladenine DNA glycosylase AlkD/uncharacterized protein YndB with AHSA1/START domain
MPICGIRTHFKNSRRKADRSVLIRLERSAATHWLVSSTRISCYINAPRASVYRVLLDARAIAKWKVPDGMTCHVHAFDGREGGLFRISLTYNAPTGTGKTTAHTDTYHGRFLKLVPNEQVVEVDEFETDDPALRGEMTITITLVDANGGTDLVAVHDGLPRGVSPADNEMGWQMALAKLATLVEAGYHKKPTRSASPAKLDRVGEGDRLPEFEDSVARRKQSVDAEVSAILTWLQRRGNKASREGMAQYAITSDKVFGVSVVALRLLARRQGRNHKLAAALWSTGWHEARMLAAFIDEPDRVTPSQMDRWCREFDNWAICDTVCSALFDRSPHAWRKVEQWSSQRGEFVKRAAFSLLWGLAVHDKNAGDEIFGHGLALIERAATDERGFVKKAVNMALRSIGKRNHALNTAAVAVAKRLAASPQAAARWVGKDALTELTSPAVTRRLAEKQSGHTPPLMRTSRTSSERP